MKISIFASIGAQNLGDELILKNEIKLLKNKYGKNTTFFVFSYDIKNLFYIDDNVYYYEYFPIGIKKIKNIFRNIINFFVFLKIIIKSDLIVIGGGGIIYDNEKQLNNNPLKQWIFRTTIIRIFNKKINFFAIGLNIKNKINLNKIKKIFYKANSITVRDNYSFLLLKKLGISSQIVQDPVFYDNNKLDFKNQKSYLIKKVNSFDFNINDLLNVELKGKKIGLALRKGYLNKQSEKIEKNKIIEIINYLLKNNCSIILLVHSFHPRDLASNDYIYLKQFIINKNVFITNTIQETYKYYTNNKMDFCLSMRLHSIILSQIYSIPFVGISYSTKTNQILDNIKGSLQNYNFIKK